jgi:hypothetical protein
MLTQMDRHLRAVSQKPANIKRKVQDLINAKNRQYMIKMSKFKNTFKSGGRKEVKLEGVLFDIRPCRR